ncbi:MAG: cysteine hydrolase family protein [Bacilli bacterium]|jgi:nicotinamidase-related amidase|nr:cysteine hydrolase family protein [Bacilli bacterium]MCH4211159.1 cysteine hydrolase family protein [Bacilli bacterium]MCH4229012.1 cysteine hydrolase family protein [Bacilli bacterium]MCH4277487.1 cysteine hydrolase family protein [Bacilli bacterium]MCI2055483.1 cysteine hydrolase family protein [Bacilli bacterium]
MKRLLVIVDYQNDFITGPLGFPKAKKYYERIKSLINEFSSNGDEIVFTRDVHDEDYLHTEEGRNLPIIHCQRGSEGTKFYGDLEKISENYPVYEKDTFGSPELAKDLLGKDYSEIVFCGVDLSICVLSNAILAKSVSPNSHVVVDLSASGSGDKKDEEVAINTMEHLQIEVCDLSKPQKNYL